MACNTSIASLSAIEARVTVATVQACLTSVSGMHNYHHSHAAAYGCSMVAMQVLGLDTAAGSRSCNILALLLDLTVLDASSMSRACRRRLSACRSRLDLMKSIRDLTEQVRKAEESGEKRAAQVMEVENQLNAIMTEMQRLEPTQRFNRSGLPS